MTKKHLLYVEDDATIAFLTKDFLENQYEVTHCSDGEVAITCFMQNTFDLCILDIMLPKKDGFEIAKFIRQKNQEIPIIFLSAKTMKEDRIKGLKLGADDYLVKPFSMEELQLKIEVFLQRSQKSSNAASNYTIGNFTFYPANFELVSEATKVQLTEREAMLLQMFLDNIGNVLKREVILTKLWGSDDYFSGRSLDVFVSRLRKIFKDHPDIKFENIPRIGFRLVI
ncbi:MAG: response regulator transcription factor [Flavobacterium sp.]